MERAETFEAFFATHYEPLLRAIYLVTGDRHEAEETVQEMFVRLYERWDRIGAMDGRVGYAYRTAVNVHRSARRRLARAARRALPGPRTDPIGESDDRDEIRHLLAELPDRQREAVVLVEWVGMSDAEAGHVLGISPGAVRVRIHRARERLRAAEEVRT